MNWGKWRVSNSAVFFKDTLSPSRWLGFVWEIEIENVLLHRQRIETRGIREKNDFGGFQTEFFSEIEKKV